MKCRLKIPRKIKSVSPKNRAKFPIKIARKWKENRLTCTLFKETNEEGYGDRGDVEDDEVEMIKDLQGKGMGTLTFHLGAPSQIKPSTAKQSTIGVLTLCKEIRQ